MQLLFEQRWALLRGGGRLFADAPIQRGALGADGVAPLAVIRRSRAVILCTGGAAEKEKDKLDMRKKYQRDKIELLILATDFFEVSV